jgi:UDP-N-acetylmuramate dehydrogenase
MNIQENIPLAPYTTFKVGGNARYFCSVKDIEGLKGALAFARARNLCIFILGGGSNIVIADVGFDGLVIKMDMKGASYEKKGQDIFVTAWAGEAWDDLVAKSVEWGAWGMENFSLIPGTVGAAPVQNIGAYGCEAKDTIESVQVIDSSTGEEKILSNSDCGFGYRDSFFKSSAGKSLVIVSVTFKLSAAPKPNLAYKDLKEFFVNQTATPSHGEIREAIIKIRTGKFPDLSVIGTAGSFWKNPVMTQGQYDHLKAQYPNTPSFPAPAGMIKVPLAWILDNVCHLKGMMKGNVGLFEKQPLVLVAKKGATAAEIKAFESEIRATVKQNTALDIEPEVGFLC